MSTFKCGTVALLGRPNAGKSTLMNYIIGSKIAIVTPKPQTTRHRILGIHTDDDGQIVFVDTPGIHQSSKQMNRNMVRVAFAAAQEADVLAIMQDVSKPLDSGTKALIERFATMDKPRIHVLNKIDCIKRDDLLPRLATLQALDAGALAWVPISARKGIQVDGLVKVMRDALPQGEPIYDPEWFTDQNQRQLAAEYVREQVFLSMNQEIPFQTAVDIELFDAHDEGIDIEAVILVGSERHKPMLIGKGGEGMKRMGMRAREGLEILLGCHVHLKLWVKVQPGWFEDAQQLHELGLGSGE
ncbi:MAG: GTPase Era [Zetaproteobacteria bacterium]|nr:GTPase Era [Zetaproteobacteria bacterium]